MLDRPNHRNYDHAKAGYDPAFERHLIDCLLRVIAEESRVDDVNAIVIRTGELLRALAAVMALTLALTPSMEVPSHLRATVEGLGKKLRRDVARARSEGVGDAFLGNSSRWGEGRA